MFKLNKVFLAVAATVFAGQAFAAPVTLADIDTARNASNINESWISGASAPTYNVFQGFAKGCDADTLSVFLNTSTTTVTKPGSGASNFLAYACARGGVVSVLYHTVDGGSFNAYAPHIPNDVDGDGTIGTTNLQRIKRLGTSTNTTCVLQTGTPMSLPGQAAIPSYRSCARVTPATAPDGVVALPAGGFSDVEAALFGVSIDGYGIEGDAGVGQVFGVAASKDLYRAMQVQQGIYADVATANAQDAAFDPAKAPSISRVQYASIASGSNGVDAILPGSSATLTLARRVATSGTQASSNAFFLRSPCNGDPIIGGALAPIKAADATPAVAVIEGSGTGNVLTELAKPGYAIGVISLENAPTSTYRYLKVDNVHPEAPVAGSGLTTDSHARYTAASGLYDFHMEMKSFTANTADSFGAQVINDIVAAFPSLACTDVPRGLTLGRFVGSSCTLGEVVAKGSRFGNNCQPQQMFK